MTLIVTDVSKAGIVMVADRAETEELRSPFGHIFIVGVRNTTKKIYTIPQLKAGISTWGSGTVFLNEGSLNTDEWIRKFIKENIDIKNINDFTKKIIYELEINHLNRLNKIGFHLSGYHIIKPYLYHINNVHENGSGTNSGEFKCDEYPLEFNDPTKPNFLVNGNNELFFTIFYTIHSNYIIDNKKFRTIPSEKRLSLIKEMKNIIPSMARYPTYGNLEERLIYYKEMILNISNLYANIDMHRTISQESNAILIRPDGSIVEYE